jgi:hypothetical protein
MQTSSNFYSNLGYWFLFLLALMFVAFLSSYFLVFSRTTTPIIHIHFGLMFIWMIMLIAQPFLIKYKQFHIHRILGRSSYVLVPLVLTSALLMMRFAYARDVRNLTDEAVATNSGVSVEQIMHNVNEFAALPFIWFIWFAVFYALAIINRGNSIIHSRFMLATGLALLGPIIDRITFRMDHIFPGFRLESLAFILADIILIILLWKDHRDKRSLLPLGIALSVFIVGQLAYFTFPFTELWQRFATAAFS